MSLSDLETFRDYARRMSTGAREQSANCNSGRHARCWGAVGYGGPKCECDCHPGAPHEPTESERQLWAQLADEVTDEVTDYLEDGDDEGLWNE